MSSHGLSDAELERYALGGDCTGCNKPRIKCDTNPNPCSGCDCPSTDPAGNPLPERYIFPEKYLRAEMWHCSACDLDFPHSIIAHDRDGTPKTKCSACGRETWR